MAAPKIATSRKPPAHAHVVNARRSASTATPRASVGLKLKRTVKAGKSKAPRPAGKRGPHNHFQGAEEEYLLTRLPDYQAAAKKRKSGVVCLAIGRDLVHKFGEGAFHLKADLKATEGVTENADSDEEADVDDEDDENGDKEPEAMGVVSGKETHPPNLTQAEADLHASRLKVLSIVSLIHEAQMRITDRVVAI